MKEESKKMPPKVGVSSTKIPNDEIMSSLLRINNFDSISSIKDDSLVDIDLSACVTISACIMNGSSISSTDFWRVLDESAQNPQLDITTCSDEGVTVNNMSQENDKPASTSFSGNFLRPEPPSSFMLSPLKTNLKAPAEQQQRKIKIQPSNNVGNKKSKLPTCLIKEEPLEEPVVYPSNENKSLKLISQPGFNVFMLPTFIPTKAQTMDTTTLEVNSTAPTNILKTPMYKCLDCNGLMLNGHKEYVTHELASHLIVHLCTVCEREFEQEVEFKKHMKTHRNMEARKDAWKKCPDCGKSLKLGSMWMHRKIHTENKKFGCDICGQKFVQKINLTHHSRMHAAEKPFECPECQKRFQERSHLQRHQKYHAQTRSYRCEKCGKMYKTERCLKVHNLVHLEQRPFACNVCDKSFISNSKLKQHSNIHTGERPFKCNYCPRDFTNFPNWLKHTRRRHKVDHKTGEHLENMPSYCSKKSSKTAKPPKAVDLSDNVIVPPTTSNTVATALPSLQKTQVRRKKKGETLDELGNRLSSSQSVASAYTINVKKDAKAKRERKQLTPKQVQKPAKVPLIKKELLETKHNNFTDLHCLSITSAEELIMEQALEMEECGLYDSAVVNNKSIETHFEIKTEFAGKEEEFISYRDERNQKFCSSIESSPFSSPASIELTPVSVSKSSNFYMPGFHQSKVVTSSCGPLLKAQTPRQTEDVSAPTIFNQLYMPLLPNQALPSVNTLLFSTHSSSDHFQSHSVRAQQNLT